MNNLFIDIETVPSGNKKVWDHIKATMKHPANMSKPETIKAWYDNPDNFKKLLDKTSLDGAFGNIAVMCVAADEGEVVHFTGSEESILKEFLKLYRDLHTPPTLIGHNITGFDIDFIQKRMFALRLGQLFSYGSRPWNVACVDTMLMFSGLTKGYISLPSLCLSLGVEKPLDEIDGSQVAEAWANGERDKVIDHCRSDVIATRDCYQAMTLGVLK